MFNVTGTASNIVTNGSISHKFSVIVTSKACEPPQSTIPLNSTDNRNPKQFYRTDTVQISTFSLLNCSDVLNTKKKWEIFSVEVNIEDGSEEKTLMDIFEIAPNAYDKPDRLFLRGT